MKKNLHSASTIVMLLLLFPVITYAQWCAVNTALPYSPNMPGITNVTVGNINRASADCENYPNNNYVNTGLTLYLTQGNTYPMSIAHTIDASICPDMNLRVYIDYNHNYTLNDAGEIVITTDHHAAGTYASSFTVPATSMLGATRMRVLAKMSNLGGHTPPTPCDNPPDPFGMHGEIEDYNVIISSATGIGEVNSNSGFSILPNISDQSFTVNYSVTKTGNVKLDLTDELGKKSFTLLNEAKTPGEHSFIINPGKINLQPGIYFVSLISSAAIKTGRFVYIR